MHSAASRQPSGGQLSRRTLLKSSVATAVTAASSRLLADEEAPAAQAIDAHVHVWTPDVERYPLAPDYTVADMQPRSFTPDELLAEARPAGVGRVVLIQMSFYGFDNRYMLAAIRDYPGMFSGVAIIDERASDAAATMRKLKEQGVRGFRIYGWKPPYESWLDSDDMAAMWRVAADERLAICTLVNPEALPPLDAMCARFPETTVVVDHFGRIGVDGQIRASDLDNLCRLARHPNTYVKVSAYYALGKKESPYTDLAPMIRRLVETFGPRRLMWASDCPYQVQNGHTYRDSIELIRSRLEFLSPADRQLILSKTAASVYFDA